ncbi:MAG: hypothetical protein ABI113_03260 [Mucilaginibacter sp.]
MTTETIRERLHEYIRFAGDKKVEAIYTMVEDEIVEELDLWEDEAFLSELNIRLENFETGKTKGVPLDEVILNAENRLKR